MRTDLNTPPRAACADLPVQVVDKYFSGNGNRDRFETAVARAICHRCPGLIDCLEAAIENPPQCGVRGGETASTLIDMHRAWLKGAAMEALVDGSLDRQLPLGGLKRFRSFKTGAFRSAGLARPEFGSAA